MHLARGVELFAAGVWLALAILAATRKGASPRAKLALIALGFIVPIGLLGFRYGPKLARRVKFPTFYEVDLNWNAPADSPRPILGYHVYRATAGSSSYELLNGPVVSETRFVDLTVQGGHTYDYYIQSVGASNQAESEPSNTIRVTVPWMPSFLRLVKAKNH
jgi:hypothetical protein